MDNDKPYILGINFKDNDYTHLFAKLMETFGRALECSSKAKWGNVLFDKEKLSIILNEMVSSHFLLFEYEFYLNNNDKLDLNNENYLSTLNYIYDIIIPDNIFINEEVNEYIEESIVSDNDFVILTHFPFFYDNNELSNKSIISII